jgi:peptidyl-prolyl cis-trans isomerase SurA
MKPRVSYQDKNNAIAKLDSIRNLIVTDSLPFEHAVAKYSQDKSTVMSGCLMTNPNSGASKFEYQELPPELARQIYSISEGDISVPFTMMDRAKNKEVCAIVRLKTKRDAHKANLADDFQVIRQMLVEKLKAETIENWIRNKQKDIYVHIDPAWRGCDFQYSGWVK